MTPRLQKIRIDWNDDRLLALPGVAKAIKENPDITPDDVFNVLVANDPTKTGKFVGWLLKAWEDKDFQWEDIRNGNRSQIHQTMRDFETFKRMRGTDGEFLIDEKNRSIMVHSGPQALWQFMMSIPELKSKMENDGPDTESNRHRKKLVSMKAHTEAWQKTYPSGMKITVPLTLFASQFFGRNTKWCTTEADGVNFHSYAEDGPLVIFTFPDGTRFQGWVNPEGINDWHNGEPDEDPFTFLNVSDLDPTKDEWKAIAPFVEDIKDAFALAMAGSSVLDEDYEDAKDMINNIRSQLFTPNDVDLEADGVIDPDDDEPDFTTEYKKIEYKTISLDDNTEISIGIRIDAEGDAEIFPKINKTDIPMTTDGISHLIDSLVIQANPEFIRKIIKENNLHDIDKIAFIHTHKSIIDCEFNNDRKITIDDVEKAFSHIKTYNIDETDQYQYSYRSQIKSGVIKRFFSDPDALYEIFKHAKNTNEKESGAINAMRYTYTMAIGANSGVKYNIPEDLIKGVKEYTFGNKCPSEISLIHNIIYDGVENIKFGDLVKMGMPVDKYIVSMVRKNPDGHISELDGYGLSVHNTDSFQSAMEVMNDVEKTRFILKNRGFSLQRILEHYRQKPHLICDVVGTLNVGVIDDVKGMKESERARMKSLFSAFNSLSEISRNIQSDNITMIYQHGMVCPKAFISAKCPVYNDEIAGVIRDLDVRDDNAVTKTFHRVANITQNMVSELASELGVDDFEVRNKIIPVNRRELTQSLSMEKSM